MKYIAELIIPRTWRSPQEDRSLALQRLALKQRHLPGSNDSIGEDPLGLVLEVETSTSQGERERENGDGGGLSFQPSCEDQNHAPPVAPVRLELGMQPELLDKLLDEIEVSWFDFYEVILHL